MGSSIFLAWALTSSDSGGDSIVFIDTYRHYHKYLASLVHLVEGVVGDWLVRVDDLVEVLRLAHLRRRLQQRLLLDAQVHVVRDGPALGALHNLRDGNNSDARLN